MLKEAAKFFPGQRRRMRLGNVELLISNDNSKKKTHKLHVSMDFEDDMLQGIPGWCSEEFTLMMKHGSVGRRYKFEKKYENMTVQIFPTPKGRRQFAPLSGCILQGFQLVRNAGEEAVVEMEFFIFAPAAIEVHQWAFEHKTMKFFADFDPAQMELVAQPEDTDPAPNRKKRTGDVVLQ